jgi:hypothetical protein
LQNWVAQGFDSSAFSFSQFSQPIMSRLLACLVVAHAAGTRATMCANDSTFAATVILGNESFTCDVINTFIWAPQRASAASDAAACDAVLDASPVKVAVWAYATACCGGADDSVCGAAPNVCANPATFNGAATVGDESIACDVINTFWGGQRGSAASDAAACDAVSDEDDLNKVIVWAAATACCGGADDSVCGAPPTTCDALAACDGEDPETKGVSAACYEAVGGIITSSGNDAPAWAVSCPETSGPAEVPPACKSGVCSALAACPGSKACASFAGCPDGCVSVNARQRRHLLFGSFHAKCPKGCAEKGMLAQSAGPN